MVTVTAVLAMACARPLPTNPRIPPNVEPICPAISWARVQLSTDLAAGGLVLVAQDGGRVHGIWPAGYSVRMDPLAQLVGPDGEIVARDGEFVEVVATQSKEVQGSYSICDVRHPIDGPAGSPREGRAGPWPLLAGLRERSH